jgi:transposase
MSTKTVGLKEIPDIAWEKIEKLLPRYTKSSKGGRPRPGMRKIMNGILYVLRTGCQWKMLPSEYGSGSTCHRYFQEWERAGVFRKLWQIIIHEYDEKKG